MPPRRLSAALILLPAALTVPWLVAEGAGTLPASIHGMLLDAPIPAATLLAVLVLYGWSATSPERRRARHDALLIPCAVAPTALMHPWAMVPGLPPASFGQFEFFLGWLTRYPDLGPVNLEVLAGIGATLATAFLPPAAALLILIRVPRPILQVVAAATMSAYLPVAIRLDAALALTALRSLAADGTAVFAAYGPVTRLFAVAALSALAIRRGRESMPADVTPGAPFADGEKIS